MDKKKLFRLVNTHFDLEEFKSLCFELEVDFDSLVGNGKEGKIRGLVSF